MLVRVNTIASSRAKSRSFVVDFHLGKTPKIIKEISTAFYCFPSYITFIQQSVEKFEHHSVVFKKLEHSFRSRLKNILIRLTLVQYRRLYGLQTRFLST